MLGIHSGTTYFDAIKILKEEHLQVPQKHNGLVIKAVTSTPCRLHSGVGVSIRSSDVILSPQNAQLGVVRKGQS